MQLRLKKTWYHSATPRLAAWAWRESNFLKQWSSDQAPLTIDDEVKL